MLCGWDWGFRSEVHHYSLKSVFDLAPPRLGVMCEALFWLHLLCFAAYRYRFWKFKQAVPEDSGWFYNRAERERDGAPLRLPLLFWKLGKARVGTREREGREECLSSWSSSHVLNSCAAGQPWVQKCVNKCTSVSFILCQTHGGYTVVGNNVDWISLHTIWKICWLSDIFFQLHTQLLTY